MSAVYGADNALDDYLLVEAVIGDKERPEGGSVDLACTRLEDYLMTQLGQVVERPVLPCDSCMFFHFDCRQCLCADAPHRLPVKNLSNGQCGFHVARGLFGGGA